MFINHHTFAFDTVFGDGASNDEVCTARFSVLVTLCMSTKTKLWWVRWPQITTYTLHALPFLATKRMHGIFFGPASRVTMHMPRSPLLLCHWRQAIAFGVELASPNEAHDEHFLPDDATRACDDCSIYRAGLECQGR